MSQKSHRRKGCFLVVLAALLAMAAWGASFSFPTSLVEPIQTLSFCKGIMVHLYKYADTHEGRYPDGVRPGLRSANEVFREFFKEGGVTSERPFAPISGSVFRCDLQVGEAPDFKNALQAGECHWMLLKGQSASSHPKTPVLIESALSASWPPSWNVSPPPFPWFGLRNSDKTRGQAWKGRRVVIGRNDGSVDVEQLSPWGTLDWYSPNNLDKNGKSWIDYLTPKQLAKLEYWDIEEKK